MPHIDDYEQVGNVFVLHGRLLREQVELMYEGEMQELRKISFRSDQKRRELFRETRETKEMPLELLKEADDKLTHTSGSASKEATEVVTAYLAYVEIAVGFGITCIKNVFVRRNYYSKVKAYAAEKIPEMTALLNTAAPTESDLQRARKLVTELQAFKGDTFDQVVKAGADISSQHLAPLVKPSASFYEEMRSVQMQLVAETGDTRFEVLLEDLTPLRKMEVYLQYMKNNAYGAAEIPATVINGLGVAGVGLLFFTAAMSCWDIYLSKTKIKTVFTEAAEFAGGYFAGGYGETLWTKAVESAIQNAIVGAGVVEASAMSAAFLSMGVFVSGTAFGIVGAKFAGYVVDEIFQCVGKHAGGIFNDANNGHRVTPPPEIFHNATVFVASSMPDASALARRLAWGPASSET